MNYYCSTTKKCYIMNQNALISNTKFLSPFDPLYLKKEKKYILPVNLKEETVHNYKAWDSNGQFVVDPIHENIVRDSKRVCKTCN